MGASTMMSLEWMYLWRAVAFLLGCDHVVSLAAHVTERDVAIGVFVLGR